MKKSTMNRFLSSVLLAMTLIVVLDSCRNTRHIVKATSLPALDTARQNLLLKIRDQKINRGTVTLKGKLNAVTVNGATEANFNVRMIQNKAIWASAGLFGFEGFRALVTKDSVKVIDKLQDSYYEDTIDYLSKLTAMTVTLEDLQYILLGRCPDFILSKNFSTTQHPEVVVLQLDSINTHYKLELNKGYNISRLEYLDTERNRSLEIDYSDYALVEGVVVPNKISLKVKGAQTKSEIELQYNKVIFKESVEMPFQIPRKIKKKLLR